MSEKLTILFVPIDGIGHFNACIGLAEPLRDRGHRVVFAIPDNWKNKLAPQGFIEEWYNPESESKTKEGNKLDAWGEIVTKMAPVFQMTPEEQIKNFMLLISNESIKQIKEYDPRLREIVARIQPDVIVVDQLSHIPAIMDSAVPWIMSLSINPLGISDKNVPPAWSGYPTGNEFKHLWDKYRQTFKNVLLDTFNEFKKWVQDNGGPKDLKFSPLFMKYSPYANIYMYPEELDYTQFRPNPPNWHRFDSFIRISKGDEVFEMPEDFKKLPGKLIYFSMGTIGSSELNMMRRLISILSKSPHRFIVSKGPFADQIQLSDNMFGEGSLPQTKVLPLVDLVISHGGNNTVTESFYFGKPMIILPLFSDQPDNAQRLAETGYGIRLHPYEVAERQLLDAIETMVHDKGLADRMSKISDRIQGSNSQARAADLIEDVARNNKIVK